MVKLYKDGSRLIIGAESLSDTSMQLLPLLMQKIDAGMVKVFKDSDSLIITIDDADGKYYMVVNKLIESLNLTPTKLTQVPALKVADAMNEKAPDLQKLNNKADANKKQPKPVMYDDIPDFVKEAEEEMNKPFNSNITPSLNPKHTVPIKAEEKISTETNIFKPFEFLSYEDLIEFFNSNAVKKEVEHILEEYTFTNVTDFLISVLEDDIKNAYERCLKLA